MPWQAQRTEPKNYLFHLYSLSSHLPQFQQSAAATPLSSLFACRTSTPYADSIREPGVFCSIVQDLWILHGSICMIKGLNISCTSSRSLSAGRLILLLYCMYIVQQLEYSISGAAVLVPNIKFSPLAD
jgi:hypothetical protein